MLDNEAYLPELSGEGPCIVSQPARISSNPQARRPCADMTIRPADRSILLRRLIRQTRDHDVAEDCLQAAFLRLEEYRQHTPVQNAVGFLSRAARNIAIDEARKLRVRGLSESSEEALETYLDEQPLQDEVLLARERLSRANAALTRLPERTRIVFLMHRFSKAKYREIAVHLGISVSAVEKHIARAVLALANSIDEDSRETGT